MAAIHQRRDIYQKAQKKDLTGELKRDKIKVEVIENRKEVGEKTILADDFIKTRGKKEEVLARQFVTTS